MCHALECLLQPGPPRSRLFARLAAEPCLWPWLQLDRDLPSLLVRLAHSRAWAGGTFTAFTPTTLAHVEQGESAAFSSRLPRWRPPCMVQPHLCHSIITRRSPTFNHAFSFAGVVHHVRALVQAQGPVIHSVHPRCLVAGQPVEMTVTGRGLLDANNR